MGSSSHSRRAPIDTPHGFSDQSRYVSLASSGALIAVSDFNRDRFIDLLLLDAYTLRDLSVMKWDHDTYSFVHTGTGIRLKDWPIAASITKIASVHVADFANDGSSDVLVRDDKSGIVFFSDSHANFNASPSVFIPELPLTSAVMDANADLIPDIFVEFQNNTRAFYSYQRHKSVDEQMLNQSGYFKLYPWPNSVLKDENGNPCHIVSPPSIAFADLDGDCLPDLLLPTSCGIEIWSNPAARDEHFWQLTTDHVKLFKRDVFNFESGDLSIVLADFDSDGTLDIAVHNAHRRDLIVYLNRQASRPLGSLCTKDSQWKLQRVTAIPSGKISLKRSKIGSIFKSIEIPPNIHVGDYDLDGHADLLFVDAVTSKPVLYKNLANWHDLQTTTHFSLIDHKIGDGLGKDNSGAIACMFFDMDESGRQDVLVVRSRNETRLMWNNVQGGWDSIFFKGTMLSALPYESKPKPFAPVPGNTIKLAYMERGSNKRAFRTCSQCPQNGHWQLQTCNCHFGLVNIANYIEEMWAGGGLSTRSWENLMPNSMAVIWAAEGGDSTAKSGSANWWMEYFTQRRGSQMLRVTAFLLLALVILAFGIMFLQHKERKEDRAEDEQERARLFNFV